MSRELKLRFALPRSRAMHRRVLTVPAIAPREMSQQKVGCSA